PGQGGRGRRGAGVAAGLPDGGRPGGGGQPVGRGRRRHTHAHGALLREPLGKENVPGGGPAPGPAVDAHGRPAAGCETRGGGGPAREDARGPRRTTGPRSSSVGTGASGSWQLNCVAEVARLPGWPRRKSGDFRYN